MKKQLFGLMTILTILSACQKNEVSVSLPEEATIHATIEDKDATRTVMDESNNVLWSENDQIIAFMKSSYGHKYQVKPSFVGKSYADFSIVSSGNGSDLSAGNEWEHNVVYYPYSENIECLKSGSNYALEVNLPAEQTYVPDSFANGSMAMVAVSESNNITFKNVLGGIKLQIKGTQTITSIKIEGKNNEKLSGGAVVTAYTDGTKPAITMASEASAFVSLNCGEGVQLNVSVPTGFIIALPPVLFSQGFTVTIKDTDDNEHTVETSKVNEVIRSSLLTMPDITIEDCTENSIQCWVDLGLNVLWASYNVGADSPEDYGGYFAWGETTEKSSYTLRNYLYYNTQTGNFEFLGTDIKETVYDAASTVWGDGARMPNKNDVEDLINHCSFEYGTYNNVKGVYAIGPNRNRIFIPFCGSREDSSLYGEGQYGDYWCSTYEPGGGSDMAYGFTLRETSKGISSAYSKFCGHSIRAVKDKETTHTNEYIDEYGINHGKGVNIDGIIWAPVNCGYHATDFKYGKLYQWGRKYGQGYDGKLYDKNGNHIGEYSDAIIPELVAGAIDIINGQSESNKNKFYYKSDYPRDWLDTANDKLWNAGTEEDPLKTQYDPCPPGWRVPTNSELTSLTQNHSTWATNDLGEVGYWLSGSVEYSRDAPSVFFSAAGFIYDFDGHSSSRGYLSYYWSSTSYNNNAKYLFLLKDDEIGMNDDYRLFGYSVRCVHE